MTTPQTPARPAATPEQTPCTSEDPGHPGLTCHLTAHPATTAHYALGYRWATCQREGCAHPATPRPVYDANPDPAARKQIGTIAICQACQARTDAVNDRVRATLADRYGPGLPATGAMTSAVVSALDRSTS